MRKTIYISALFVLVIAFVACLFVISNRNTKPEIIYNPPTDEMMTNIKKKY